VSLAIGGIGRVLGRIVGDADPKRAGEAVQQIISNPYIDQDAAPAPFLHPASASSAVDVRAAASSAIIDFLTALLRQDIYRVVANKTCTLRTTRRSFEIWRQDHNLCKEKDPRPETPKRDTVCNYLA
jgi:hypothetical protein